MNCTFLRIYLQGIVVWICLDLAIYWGTFTLSPGSMRSVVPLIALLLSSSLLAQTPKLSGFAKDQADAQLRIEKQFDAVLSASNMKDWMKTLTARPHHLGSTYGKQSAEFIASQFRNWGYDTKIETFHVLFPTPKVRILEMRGPKKFKAKLAEATLKEDATSGQKNEQLPTFNCYSPDGDVTGQLVFVGYGLPDDYEQLERMGIDVKGKIVIARYGRSWRGIKPKVAQEHGAIGCIIYSDPEEDGYYQGDVYPHGAYKNNTGAQRGSVIDLPVAPGDPLTPGYGSTENAERIDRKESTVLLKIPVLPISYSDAEPLLAALRGPVAPEGWRGALPLTYHVGPGPAAVHLKLEFNWDIVPCYNVIAMLKGAEQPDEWVIRGNHHDAWVNGASDPVSGLVAMMEEARSVSELVKGGWKPKRTIVYCAWDGEEPGLLGSTEWVETHSDELKQKAVAYINSDWNGPGFLYAGGSHTLQTFITEIASDVRDPETNVSLLERGKAVQAARAFDTKSKLQALDRKEFHVGALGSGSDYSPFFQHLGIPSLNIGFAGEGGGGEYHSIYDSYDDFIRFKDPTFEYGIALAETGGRATLRLAEAERLPFQFTPFYKVVNGYLTEVIALVDNMRKATDAENRMIRENRFVQAADPARKFVAPSPKEPVPYLDFSPLQNALAILEKASGNFDKQAATTATASPDLNQLLYRAEQKLLADGGLPRRPWYRHTIYSPGYYTGYGVKTLPGIREAIEQRNWDEAQQQITIAAKALEAYSADIEKASVLLR
jgi:N-acetylated-alpha-linked acidic dipeptidase